MQIRKVHEAEMLLAYVDETGDPGSPHRPNPGSADYTLGALLIDDTDWTYALNEAVRFRRYLRNEFGIPVRVEIKASHLVNNKGWFKGKHLSPNQRKYILREHLRLVGHMKAKAFAVHVDKRTLMDPSKPQSGSRDPEQRSWEGLFQRLAKTYEASPKDRPAAIHLSHDEGNNASVRKLARRARTYLTAGQVYGRNYVQLSSGWLIDDPVPRKSNESYFIQVADIVAWTASRTLITPGASGRRLMASWSDLGSGCYEVVNRWARKSDPDLPPGIVIIK